MGDNIVEEEETSGRRRSLRPIYSKFTSILELTVKKEDASNIVVFGKKLQLYPLIARRIWAVLDPEDTKISTFLKWMDALRVISFGSFYGN